jgi:hypothetical protein
MEQESGKKWISHQIEAHSVLNVSSEMRMKSKRLLGKMEAHRLDQIRIRNQKNTMKN